MRNPRWCNSRSVCRSLHQTGMVSVLIKRFSTGTRTWKPHKSVLDVIVSIDIRRLLQLLLGVFEEACRTRIQSCLGKDRRHQLHDNLTLVSSWGYLKYVVFHKNPHTQYGNLNMPFSENFVAFLQTLSPRFCAICFLVADSSWASNTSYSTCFGFSNAFYEVRREIWLTKKEVTSIELSQDKESNLLIDHTLGKERKKPRRMWWDQFMRILSKFSV